MGTILPILITKNCCFLWHVGQRGTFCAHSSCLSQVHACLLEPIGPKTLHINGNALYTLHDPSFEKFLRDMVAAYAPDSAATGDLNAIS